MSSVLRWVQHHRVGAGSLAATGIRVFFDALELADVLRYAYEWAFVGMSSIRLTSNGKNGVREFCTRPEALRLAEPTGGRTDGEMLSPAAGP